MQAKYRIFWLYAVLITTLGGYAWHLHAQKKRQMAQYYQMHQTVLQMRNSFIQRISFQLNQLDMIAQGSPSPHNQGLYLHGKSINQMLEAFEEFLTSNAYPSQSTFFQHKKSFADSLYSYTQNHRLQGAALAPFFANERQVAFENINAGHRADQKAILLFLSEINYLVAANQTLAFLANQTDDGYRLSLGSLFPLLSLEGDCHRRGELIRGVVSARLYYRNSSNLTCFVQNKKLGIENGLGKFSSVFHEAGMHNLPVRIEVQNPLTQMIMAYFRNDTIKVCE